MSRGGIAEYMTEILFILVTTAFLLTVRYYLNRDISSRKEVEEKPCINSGIQAAPVGLWQGKKTVMCVAGDLADERSLEEQFLQAQKMEAIGRLAGGVAHDFNNILSAIMGYAELSLLKVEEGDPLRKNLDAIYNASLRAARLVEQLLSFSRKKVIRPRVLNFNTILDDMRGMLMRMIGDDLKMEFVKDGYLWNVKADISKVEQMIMNLAVNARDAMPLGGTFTIKTENVFLDDGIFKRYGLPHPGEYVKISFSDNGIGMTEDVKKHMFEPFFTTKVKGKGTGLGLATVYGVVKQMEGGIDVYSEPGKGAVFNIYCLRADEEIGIPEKEPGIVLPPGSETILLVEDDEDVRSIAVSILSGLGYNVLKAENGEDAIEICNEYQGRIDLLLTDVIMPGISGGELAGEIKMRSPHVRLIYMSGYAEDSIMQYGVLNEVEFIRKPLTPHKLAISVRKVLDGQRAN